MTDPVPTSDDVLNQQRKRRHARTQAFFKEDFPDQDTWYNSKSVSFKKWGNWLGYAVIIAGALTAALPAFTGPLQSFFGADSAGTPYYEVAYVTTALGLIVTLAQGALRIWRYDELWVPYRKAHELIRRERALYVNDAGDYAGTSEDDAYRKFVDRIEQIVAEEQQFFFDLQKKADPARSRDTSQNAGD